MHSFHYQNLPFTFKAYCHKPVHEYSTRYKTLYNYTLPCTATNRGQRSIKFSGPKAWVNVPKQLKEIAFRKPFSKSLKEHILDTIYVEMPPKKRPRNHENAEIALLNLYALFNDENDEGEFFGFDSPPPANEFNMPTELNIIFSTSSDDEELYGFGSTSQNSNLASIFHDERNESEFFGF